MVLEWHRVCSMYKGAPAFNCSEEYPKKSLAWLMVFWSQAQLAPKNCLEYEQHLQVPTTQQSDLLLVGKGEGDAENIHDGTQTGCRNQGRVPSTLTNQGLTATNDVIIKDDDVRLPFAGCRVLWLEQLCLQVSACCLKDPCCVALDGT